MFLLSRPRSGAQEELQLVLKSCIVCNVAHCLSTLLRSVVFRLGVDLISLREKTHQTLRVSGLLNVQEGCTGCTSV